MLAAARAARAKKQKGADGKREEEEEGRNQKLVLDSGVIQVVEERSYEMVELFSVGIENDKELEEHQPEDF